MGYLGIEPRAFRLKAEYSTIELVTLSNLIKTGLTGFEPATSTVTGWCSHQLNYNPKERAGFEPTCILYTKD